MSRAQDALRAFGEKAQVRQEKAKATYRGYRTKGNRVKQAFKDRQIASVTRSELELYQANLVDEAGLDPKTVNDIFTVIRGVWSAAAGDSISTTPNSSHRTRRCWRT